MRATSFVGSGLVACHLYEVAAAHGKRVQSFGGAKNLLVVMPNADLKLAVLAILDSTFGNAGDRCLASSLAMAIGEASTTPAEPLKEQTEQLWVGPGGGPGVKVGQHVHGTDGLNFYTGKKVVVSRW